MPLIILIAALVGLRYFEVWKFAQLSWGWIVGLMVLAFIWFEFLERIFGVDKRQAHNELEKTRKERVGRMFEKKKAARK